MREATGIGVWVLKSIRSWSASAKYGEAGANDWVDAADAISRTYDEESPEKLDQKLRRYLFVNITT